MPIITSSTEVSVIDALPATSVLQLEIYAFTGSGYRPLKLLDNGIIPTHISTRLSTNRFVVPSLDRRIYIYAFGSLPMRVNIAGLLIRNEGCGSSNKAKVPLHYLDYISQTYMLHNSSYPMYIVIDGGTIQAYLDHVSFEFRDPAQRIGGFVMSFIGIPGVH